MSAIVIEPVKFSELPELWRAKLATAHNVRTTVCIEEEICEDTGSAFGMWRDRQDLADGAGHVRQLHAKHPFVSQILDTGLAQTASRQKGKTMTTLEVKFDLPDRLAREAQALLSGTARATAAGSKPLSTGAIQAGLDAVRKPRRRGA